MNSVFIAIPNMGTNVRDLTQSLLLWYMSAVKLRVKLNMPPYMPIMKPLDASRNMIVKEFLKSDFESIWWIDSDIVPPIDALERMVNTMRRQPLIDALGAVCFSMREHEGSYFPFPVTLRKNEEGNLKVYYGTGRVEWVDAVGGACVMVRRRVYEALKRPYEYHYHEDGTRELDCDFDIWLKAKDAGFSLYVDFSILCDHQQVCSIKGIQDLLASFTRDQLRKVSAQ